MLTVIQGNALTKLENLPDASVQCCVTSPPYWGLRDYGIKGQIGLEATPEEYVSKLVFIFRQVYRVLKNDGTLWLNLGDSYVSDAGRCRNPGEGENSIGKTRKDAGAHPLVRPNISDLQKMNLKPKNLVGIPWLVAFALRADGWYLRSDIIWSKPNPMPESVRDRPTKAHEYLFLLSKSHRYYYDQQAIAEPIASSTINGQRRNKRTVWTIATQPYSDAHFATFPEVLVEPCILAGSPSHGIILDPFAGSGTVGRVALRLGRQAILIELNPKYVEMIEKRCAVTLGLPY